MTALMALGMFQFDLSSAPFRELQRRSGWRHAFNSRVGARPAGQYLGPGDDQITLTGTIAYGVLARPGALDELRAMASEGVSWPLVGGDGEVFGAFVIEDVTETRRELFQDGTPRLSDFTLQLRRVDDDEDDAEGGS